MSRLITLSPAKIRSINRMAIIEFLRLRKVASRTEISESLGLSLPSVVRIIDELLDLGYVIFNGKSEKSGGRKRNLLELNSSQILTISVDISDKNIDGYLIDLNGFVYRNLNKKVDCYNTPLMISELEKMLSSLIIFAQSLRQTLIGIAIIVPGLTDPDTGKVIQASRLGLKNYPLGSVVYEKFQLPVFVENDSNAAALGELWFDTKSSSSNLALIHLREGLGVGLVVDGEIYRGSNSSAGELGHIVLDSNDFSSKYSEYGPAEKKVAGIGISDAAKEIADHEEGKNREEAINFECVFKDYLNGEKWPVKIVDDFVDVLSKLVIIINALFNPSKIIISGEVVEVAFPLIDRVRENIYSNISIEVSAMSGRSFILGGAVGLFKSVASGLND